MIETKPYVLIIDDEKDLRNLLHKELKLEGYRVKALENAQDMQNILKTLEIDVVLLDIAMPGIDGIQALQILKTDYPEIEVVILTGNATVESAIQAMKLGAFDYITKPYHFDTLLATLQKAYEHKCAIYTSDLLRREIAFKETSEHEHQMVGQSPAIQKIFTQILQVAASDSIVLITGETGTGKELVARSIHNHSTRKDKSFIGINCGSLVPSILYSELFGYEKGAFTGAYQKKPGLFEVASGGTVFLDEIGDMALENQAHLLRAIESKQIRRLGAVRDIDINIRIIAATNKVLAEEIRETKFREDLFYRLNVFNITLPPLRERKEDIPILVDYFMRTIKIPGKTIEGIDPNVLLYFQNYDWPGNVRELHNIMERAFIITSHKVLSIHDFPNLTQNQDLPSSKSNSDKEAAKSNSDKETAEHISEKILPLEEMEKIHITKALQYFHGNRAKTASALAISPRSLYDKINKYHLEY